MEQLTITLEPLACESCFETIQDKLEQQDGVGEVAAYFKTNKLVIQFNLKQTDDTKLTHVVTDLGYNVAKTSVER
ncbi:heavy-metal-associated domain-containing protein [Lapidilactobacillus mulanensis]|uniref:Heavy-metal-associated domain-containing protein n=1 Tax=Lapidilactobacillus mulanensis TaxID=2485999 RepID=A0ABW4DN87_9LACO|nr:heavy-metal-associated domain-containing protein [Lapidilactobacillus mulanensis]